jgi:preprotein translocase subunit SecA
MDRMGIEEGEVIQHSMITSSIERAQKKVEENNFGTRKRLLEYDDVMNSQREVVYSKRRHALFGERLALDISNMLFDVSENTVNNFQDQKDFEGFQLELIRLLSIESPVNEQEFLKLSGADLTQKIFDHAYTQYLKKSNELGESTFPVVKNVYEQSAHIYENIVIPFTDGIKTLQVISNLKKAYETKGRDVFTSFEKGVTLSIIDEAWKDHLRAMDDLKQSVQNAVYEQKDPLLVYKFESFNLFKALMIEVNSDIISFLVKAYLPKENQQAVKEVAGPPKNDLSQLKTSKTEASSDGEQPQDEPKKAQPVRVEKQVGRNDPCPCGSGKKYKHCHGK